MIDLRDAKRIAIIGGGTAGWFAALTLRRISAPKVEIVVFEDPDKGIIGVGEGSQAILVSALRDNGIDIESFIKATDATYKLGISYENWAGKGHSFFHPFCVNHGFDELNLEENGTWPLLVQRMKMGLDLYSFLPDYALIANKSTQEETKLAMRRAMGGLTESFHFDSYKFATYLKTIAEKRGIKNQHIKIQQFLLDESGKTRALKTEAGDIDVDFVIDSTGLRRLGIGETYKQKWRSFADQLILDRALPFPIPHPNKKPALMTRAIAMDSGWMWQIPLIHRTGTGYVYSSAHMNEDQAVQEAEKFLGHKVEPRGVIEFTPGHFENVWCHNVLALGLSSGFLEPLEATSISQMLVTLREFAAVVVESRGVIGQNTIDTFNVYNRENWNELRDFLRMHYDGKRQDTPFWKDVLKLPRSDRYAQMLDCFAQRLPRKTDIEPYFKNGWPAFYDTTSWLMNAAPLGLVPMQAVDEEIINFTPQTRDHIRQYEAYLRSENLA